MIAGAEAEAGAGQRIAIGPGRMHVDDRQPARRLGHRLHEVLGLVEPHGVRRIVFIGLEVEGQQGPGAGPRNRQEERRLLCARRLSGAEMIGAPQQSRRLGLGASRGARRVGIVAAFGRLMDDAQDVALAHRPEVGDGHESADVDHRVQSQRRAIRRRRRDRILIGRQGRRRRRCILPRSKPPGPREGSCERSCADSKQIADRVHSWRCRSTPADRSPGAGEHDHHRHHHRARELSGSLQPCTRGAI